MGLTALLTVAAIVLFLLFPARYAESVREGISLWAANVLPVTLPLLFLTALLSRQEVFFRLANALSAPAGALFGISGGGALCVLLSAISGYPVGARTTGDLVRAGAVSEEELFRVSVLATTSGPAFLVGAVGLGMLSSPALGWLLYLAHLGGVFLVALFLKKGKRPPSLMPRPEKRAFPALITDSVLSVLTVGGAIALFYVFGEMLSDLCILFSVPTWVSVTLRGLAEMTTGCALLAQDVTPLSLAGQAFFVTFGGMCVLVQQLTFLGGTGLNVKRWLLVKFLQALAAGGIALLLALLFAQR